MTAGYPFGWPATWELGNWAETWTVGKFAEASWNSTLTTLVSSFVTAAVATPAAFYLGRVDNRPTSPRTQALPAPQDLSSFGPVLLVGDDCLGLDAKHCSAYPGNSHMGSSMTEAGGD